MSLILFAERGFRGPHKHVIGRDEPNLHWDEWGDRVSSVQVVDGMWELFEHVNFGGASLTVAPGAYPDLEAAGFVDNMLSSVRRQPPAPLLSNALRGLILYDRTGFRGRHKHVIDWDEPDLSHDSWDGRVRSIQVLSGRWQVAGAPGYEEWSVALEPGLYPDLADTGIKPGSLLSVMRRAPLWPVTPLPVLEGTLYDFESYGGRHRHFVSVGDTNLHRSDFGDRAASAQITAGSWTFHRDIFYSGPAKTLAPGDYPKIADVGIPANSVSSVRANVILVAFVVIGGWVPWGSYNTGLSVQQQIDRDLERARAVFQQYDIDVFELARIHIDAPELINLDTDCDAAVAPTLEENSLFQLARARFPGTIVAYYVKDHPWFGCSSHPPGKPGVMITGGSPMWTLAHELGHLLGLSHVTETDNLMLNGTPGITSDPPVLTASQRARVRASRWLV